MYLLTLRLENFQGIKEALFDFNGNNANIYGDNATGKTTVFNSLTWLLFDKPSTGAKNFTPKTKGIDGDLHYLDHSAEASFSMDTVRIVTLKKIYRENYKKKRGSAFEEFDGHVTDYYIDGVPCSTEKEYKDAVTNFFGTDERMKTLMMPDYFSEELSWEARRKILLNACGDISDNDVISSNPELKDLLMFLLMPGTADQYYTVDEFKKIANGKRTEINKDLQTIPARIDEAKKAMPDVTGINFLVIDSAVATINAEIEEKEQEKRQILSGDVNSTMLRKQVSVLQTELAESRTAYAVQNSKLNEAIYEEINRLKAEQMNIKNTLDTENIQMRRWQHEYEDMKRVRQSLLDEYASVQSKQWHGEEICPTCKRALPQDEIEQAKETFNLNKSQKLEEINLNGQRECSKDMIADYEKQITKLIEKIQSLNDSIRLYDTLIYEAEQKLKQPVPFEKTDDYSRISSQISELKEDETKAGQAVSQRVITLSGEITSLQEQIKGLTAEKSKLTIAEQQMKRIKELDDMEKALSREYEELQRGVYLCEEFIKAKVSMLTEKINGKFSTVRFRLFIEQLNGGLKEDCEVMIPSEGRLVPYAFANNAARINAGLEIIDALSKHWNLSMPVFVDNAESVTRLNNIRSQLVRLVVSEHDKSLRLELDEKADLRKVI